MAESSSSSTENSATFNEDASQEIVHFAAHLVENLLPAEKVKRPPPPKNIKYNPSELLAVRDQLPASNFMTNVFKDQLPESIALPTPSIPKDAGVGPPMSDGEEVKRLEQIMRESDYYHTAEYMSLTMGEQLQQNLPLAMAAAPWPPAVLDYQEYQDASGLALTQGPVMKPPVFRKRYRPYSPPPARYYTTHNAERATDSMARLKLFAEDDNFNAVSVAALEPYNTHGNGANNNCISIAQSYDNPEERM